MINYENLVFEGYNYLLAIASAQKQISSQGLAVNSYFPLTTNYVCSRKISQHIINIDVLSF